MEIGANESLQDQDDKTRQKLTIVNGNQMG
uniref:Uncharacterized protein n=1 Tax=Anguilla anguilla TaxID=7936 RepID=A0A0E9QFT4_ANGAN